MRAIALTWFCFLIVAAMGTLRNLLTKQYPRQDSTRVEVDALVLAIHVGLVVWIATRLWP